MASASRLFIILPAFNESRALSLLLPDLLSTVCHLGRPFKIFVVDDGSQDDTAKVIAAQMAGDGVQRLAHDRNRGYGAALSTGVERVLSDGMADDIAITMDSDNTHWPRYIPDLIARLDEGFDVVTASYAMLGGRAFGVPPLRRVMSRGVNRLFRWAYPLGGLTTYTNGFRAYRVRALQQAAERFGRPLIRETGFPGGTELFLKVCRAGGRPAEVPFELHYEMRGPESKIHLGQTIQRYLRLLHQARDIRRS